MKKIKLWKNRNELSDKVALVDDEDYDKIVEAIRHKNGVPGKWYLHHGSMGPDYTYAQSGDRKTLMHRVIMDAPKGMDVDHANGQRLDNRKENLRVCTRAQNAQNKKLRKDSKSGFKGVYQDPGKKYTSKKTGDVKVYCLKKPWRAYISDPETEFPNKRHLRLGRYATAEEAAAVYDKKAVEMYGDFALLNFPERTEEYRSEIQDEK